jgi:protein-tyrosine phosphatase
MKVILFLCTGNYYRSRFAEEMLNSLAPGDCPGWMAISRGIAVDLGVNNVGPIARSAADALANNGITFTFQHARMPLQLELADFETADHVVALDRTEHRPLLQRRFPSWVGSRVFARIEYWHVADIDQIVPERGLLLITEELQRLMKRLSGKIPEVDGPLRQGD